VAEPFRVRVEDIHLKANVPAGMCPFTLLGLVRRLRDTAQDWDPVLVRRDGRLWELLDGRHRWMASVIAGRPDVLAVEECAEYPLSP
jgi:hypothetical protein